MRAASWRPTIDPVARDERIVFALLRQRLVQSLRQFLVALAIQLVCSETLGEVSEVGRQAGPVDVPTASSATHELHTASGSMSLGSMGTPWASS